TFAFFGCDRPDGSKKTLTFHLASGFFPRAKDRSIVFVHNRKTRLIGINDCIKSGWTPRKNH
ncbi:MAG: hypothetical protein ACREX0_15500, partial [Noviherbaspirillum sp.]